MGRSSAELAIWLLARVPLYDLRYNPDQPRDEHGRWGDSAGNSFDSKVEDAASGQDAIDAATVAVSPSVASALGYYESNAAYELNAAMREGNGSLDNLTDAQRAAVEKIDGAMIGARQNFIAYRSIDDPSAVFGPNADQEDLTGRMWTDHGFVSTDPNPPVPGGMFSQTNMTVYVPKGTSVLANDRLESEILLGRGQTFRVARDNGYSAAGDRLLDVEVVPGG